MPNVNDYIQLHPKQQDLLRNIGKGDIIFFGGSKGGGKSHACLCIACIAGMQFPNLMILIMRKHYDELEQVFIRKFRNFFPESVFGYTYNKKERTVMFKNGSRILFRAGTTIEDANKHFGIEYQFVIIDEANQFDESIFPVIRGSLRNATDNGFVPTLVMTGNPGGFSDAYFKTHFIQPDKNAWTDDEWEFRHKYIFIPSSVYDNPTLQKTPEYVNQLKSLPEHQRRAWLDGDWNVFEGQFFEEWREKIHVCEPFPIPKEWTRMGGLDIGGSKKHPTVLIKIAQNPMTLDLYVYDEYSSPHAIDVALAEIKDIVDSDQIHLIWADPSAFNKQIKLNQMDQTVAEMFKSEGIVLKKATNDRVNGWRVFKSWLHWDTNNSPKLRIFSNCEGLIRTLPAMRYDPRQLFGSSEDCDTKGPDDYCDAARYALMSGFQFPTESILDENFELRKRKSEMSPEEIIKRMGKLESFESPKKITRYWKPKEKKLSWV